MTDIIVVIIERSGGRIRSLKDLAYFLKDNLNLGSYKITHEEPGLIPLLPKKSERIVSNAARYGGAVKLLMNAFNLDRKQAEDVLDLLEDAGWIKIERMLPDWTMGWRDSSLVIFNI